MFKVIVSIKIPAMHGLTALDFCRKNGLKERGTISPSIVAFSIPVSERFARRFSNFFLDSTSVSTALSYESLVRGDLIDDPYGSGVIQAKEIPQEQLQEMAMLAIRFPQK